MSRLAFFTYLNRVDFLRVINSKKIYTHVTAPATNSRCAPGKDFRSYATSVHAFNRWRLAKQVCGSGLICRKTMCGFVKPFIKSITTGFFNFLNLKNQSTSINLDVDKYRLVIQWILIKEKNHDIFIAEKQYLF